jgi:hypothetical protein
MAKSNKKTEKEKYERLKLIRKKVESGEKLSFSERNILNIVQKKKSKKSKE